MREGRLGYNCENGRYGLLSLRRVHGSAGG